MSLGLPHGENYLVEYDPAWPRLFEEERARLRAALPEAVEIEHVGSTSVPGPRAKPIIDVLVGAPSYRSADEWRDAMAAIGYDYPGDIGVPEHRIFGRDRDVRRFLVHVVDVGGARWSRFIDFRARLRADPGLAREYEAIKLDAAARHPTGRASYTDAKTTFIDRVAAGG